MILQDASGGAISTEAGQTLQGYAAYGRSMRSAIEPLVEAFGIDLIDDGDLLKSPSDVAPVIISAAEFGNSADSETLPRLEREQSPSRTVPTAVRIAYYDPARDFQTGEARASAADEVGGEAQHELPAALAAGEAKSLAQSMLARAWVRRDKLTLRLPRNRIGLQPGSRLELPLNPSLWTIEKVAIDGFVPIVELRPARGPLVDVASDPGRIVPNNDVAAGAASIALIDIPILADAATDQPTILLAASQATSGWRSRPMELSFSGQSITAQTARSKSVLGYATTALQSGTPYLIDDVNSVEVGLIDAEQWLTSCDDEALAAGSNLAVIGSEICQFAVATALGAGRFRLSRLLRGRAGTEWARVGHLAGDTFCLLRPGTLQAITLPSWSMGAEISATIAGSIASASYRGEALRPLSPVNLLARTGNSGELSLSWTRRSRRGFAWLDGVDVPLAEARERYRITVTGTQSIIEFEAEQPELTIDAASLESAGLGAATVEVAQIGDFLASRPTSLSIVIA